MKKLIAIIGTVVTLGIAAALFALVLHVSPRATSEGSVEAKPTAVQVEQVPVEEKTVAPTNDEVYLKSIKVAYPVLEGTSDADLVSLANSLCAAFDKSATYKQVLALGLDAGLDAEMAGYLIGAAVNVYCPNHLDEIN